MVRSTLSLDNVDLYLCYRTLTWEPWRTSTTSDSFLFAYFLLRGRFLTTTLIFGWSAISIFEFILSLISYKISQYHTSVFNSSNFCLIFPSQLSTSPSVSIPITLPNSCMPSMMKLNFSVTSSSDDLTLSSDFFFNV